jgi:hypothetical protein
MPSADFIPIGSDWWIRVPLTDERTRQPPNPQPTLTATLKTEAGVVVNVAGQGDATATMNFNATLGMHEGTIPGLRLTGLTPPTSLGVETFYVLWITEASGKVNRRIRLPARYQQRA